MPNDLDAYLAAMIDIGADAQPGADGTPDDEAWGGMQAVLDQADQEGDQPQLPVEEQGDPAQEVQEPLPIPTDPVEIPLLLLPLAGAPMSAMFSWSAFQGPHGGHGWKNSSTGEVRYQSEKPSDRDPAAQDAATTQPSAQTPQPEKSSPPATQVEHARRPEADDFTMKVLSKFSRGSPGLTMTADYVKIGALEIPGRQIVYRNPNGEPIGAAIVVEDAYGKLAVKDFAIDKNAGLLASRAAVAIGKRLVGLGATTATGTMSPDAARLLENYQKRQQEKIQAPPLIDPSVSLAMWSSRDAHTGRFLPAIGPLCDDLDVCFGSEPPGPGWLCAGAGKWLRSASVEALLTRLAAEG